ncbi:hypothetical protein F7725_016275, partial [Dissostichus mawsoni]
MLVVNPEHIKKIHNQGFLGKASSPEPGQTTASLTNGSNTKGFSYLSSQR